MRGRWLTLSFLLAATYLFALNFCFESVWETNDDVAMSMVAHGYGFVASGSANLLFSNVVWGWLVRQFDGLFGLGGYSVGTVGVLLLSAWAYLYFLGRLSVRVWLAIPAVVSVLSWPILFPQFTVNAGLITGAGMLGIYAYGRCGKLPYLVASCVLVFIGFVIRPLEFALVVLVALPVMPWTLLAKDRWLQIACATTLLTFCGAFLADDLAYKTEAWKAFDELNLARAAYTDFGAANRVKLQPDVLEKYGYTTNDINLIANWFFEDSLLAQPASLKGMLAALGPNLGPLSTSRPEFDAGLAGLSQLLSPRLLLLGAGAAITLLLYFNLQVFASGLLVVTAIFALASFGASVPSRVTFPVVALLAILAVAQSGLDRSWRSGIAIPCVMIGVMGGTLFLLLPLAAASSSRVEVARAALLSYDQDLLYVWGGNLDFEASYPLKLAMRDRELGPSLYALGVMAHAPFSVPTRELEQKRGLINELREPGGIEIVINDHSMVLLRNYCQEHLRSSLSASIPSDIELTGLLRLNCATPIGP